MSEVRSAGRVLDILQFLQTQAGPKSLSAIATALLLPKSSTLLLLRTLVTRGYVIRTRNDLYHATIRLALHDRLVEVARPVMREVCAETRETVLLGVLASSGRVRALAKEVSPQDLRYDADLAPLRPGYCTAMGRVLLAGLPPEQQAQLLGVTPLKPFTPHTVTEPDALRTLLGDVAAKGYADVDEEYAIGGAGVAAPVRDAHGGVIAALDIASVKARFNLVRESLTRAAVDAADLISRRLREADIG